MKVSKIEDFGNKIGGAKKDWYESGLKIEDMQEMTEAEKDKYVVKKNVFPRPDYEQIKNDSSVIVSYFMKKVYDSLPVSPVNNSDIERERYIRYMEMVKNELEECTSEAGMYRFCSDFLRNENFFKNTGNRYSITPKEETSGLVSNKTLKAVRFFTLSRDRIINEIIKKKFQVSEAEIFDLKTRILKFTEDNFEFEKDYSGRDILKYHPTQGTTYFIYNQNPAEFTQDTYVILFDEHNVLSKNYASYKEAEEGLGKIRDVYVAAKEGSESSSKNSKPKKKKFTNPSLDNLQQTNYNEANISGQDYLDTFNFFGGEFGNWVGEAERQECLNRGFVAFENLARILSIDKKDITADGKLSIAFGARGNGNAVAHYEPLRNVINLTRMKGAGSLAHEWGHFLDDYLGTELEESSKLLSEIHRSRVMDNVKIPEIANAFCKVIDTCKIGENRHCTDYYNESVEFDKQYSKDIHGYWSSSTEMFARAFACYVSDKGRSIDIRDDYLCGHCESGPVPHGKERERINEAMDELFDVIKEKQLFHEVYYERENDKIFEDDLD